VFTLTSFLFPSLLFFPLTLSFLFTSLLVYLLTYLSTPSRIDPFRFQGGGRRRRPSLALGDWKNPQNNKKITKSVDWIGYVISRMHRKETVELIWRKFCPVVGELNIITHADFVDHRLRGLGGDGQISPLPLTFIVILTTFSLYCLSVWFRVMDSWLGKYTESIRVFYRRLVFELVDWVE